MKLELEQPFKSDLKRPIIISGPCSAESPEQVMETCVNLAKHNVNILRAGVWKPRTRPNTFEGVGTEALKWIKDAGKETGLPVTIEVATAKHVEESLEAGIDILWIGARTTVNPFAVQEIADALKGVDIPVMVKNPVNPDLELWLGAFERLNNSGIKKLAAIHRGFSSYEKGKYRNQPHWELPIELKRRFPEMPLICDPSHITGDRKFLQEVSQEAIDLNYDGLMIESHRDPSVALSDAKQQVKPDELAEILSKLVLRKVSSDNSNFNNKLDELRSQINKIDTQLIDMLSSRMQVVSEIGKYKKENNITILQPSRWDEILHKMQELAKGKHLSDRFIMEIFQSIHTESIEIQNKIMNS
ncbi:MAG: bifunctional 3-deoxy-7-phosphoheptulonate synthase/chorismate mutase type II [Candidatus Sericytochromatia bacterium]